MLVAHANLDCESTWGGLALPVAVQQRISLYGTLLGALAPVDAPDDFERQRREDLDGKARAQLELELWTPAPVDPARLQLPWRPRLRTGTPPRADLAWADPAARAANDRRLAHHVVAQHGLALPGSRVITRVDDLELAGEWIAKLPWTAAGRDRCRGRGAPTPDQRTRLERLLAVCGALVVEPWCERIVDVGVCATVDPHGVVTAHPPHGLLTDPRGGFLGIDLAGARLEPGEHAQLAAMVAAAGAAISGTGYAGRFAIDAFAYRAGGERRFHPLCEINARTTFGWVAWACAAWTQTTRLGFGEPPDGARVLIAPGSDRVTAWIA